jgi:hypothetical protein
VIDVPPLSPEWPPNTDQLAEIARRMHWRLEQLAYDLEHHPHAVEGRLGGLAADLSTFAYLLQRHDADRE